MKSLIGILGITSAVGCGSPSAPSDDLRSEPRWASLGKVCADDAPAPSLSEDLRQPLPPPNSVAWDANARWAAIAGRVPGGWGGLFLDNAGQTIYLRDPTLKDEAIAVLATEGFNVTPSTHVKRGRWDFAQLYDWFRYLVPYTITIEGVSFIDIQETRNRIEYGVINEAERARLEETLAALDLPCFPVAIEIRPHPVPR